ncbi:hypothetical protein F5Y11DRAFT_340338 [Daldinia sp. FL1419]|nr:hypothetical protein F5Y11DRAFT_340338 [Daldinia sp. FL1419]
MTSYTAPRESEPLPPGSFPTDDMIATQDSSLTSSGSHQHNKLHKREDPRGWSDEEKAARGHQHTDSGVGLTDPSLTSSIPYRSKANDGGFQSNNVTPQNNDVAPDTFGSTTTRSPNYQGNVDKPGVMTGAYGHNDANSGNDYYPKSTVESTPSQNQTSAKSLGAVGPATGIATATTSDNRELGQGLDDRNIIRNGLRQTSNVDHQDPYWGEVPFGTGVYNTVTGHGSPETATEGSVHPHGPTLNHEQQRAFPLATSNTTRDNASHRNGSRFKESLGESTTGATAGLTAAELAEKRRDHHRENDITESTSYKHHEAEPKKESKLGGLFHRDHKDHKGENETASEKKVKEPVPSKDNRPLTERDAGVALATATGAYGAKKHADKHDEKARETEHSAVDSKTTGLYQHPNGKVDSDDPFLAAGYKPSGQGSTKLTNNAYPPSEDVTTRDHPFTSQTTEKPSERNDSKLGYSLAAAGVGAGAGYAAHEHSRKNSEKTKVHPNQQAFHDSTPASKATPQPSDVGYTIGKPQLGVFADSPNTSTRSEREQSVPQTTTSGTRSLDDPSRHGEYNVLQDGTPSGINVGDHYGDKKNVATSSPDATRDAAKKDNYTDAKLAAAGAGVAGAGAAARYTGKRHSNASSTPYEVSGANGSTYKTLPTGTPSGVGADDKSNVATSSPTSATRGTVVDSTHNHNQSKAAAAAGAAGAAGVAGAGAAAKHHHSQPSVDSTSATSPTSRDHYSPTTNPSTRASTDSSHGGQYNVLPSGTPSGINIGERDDLGRKSLENSAGSKVAKAPTTAANAAPTAKKDLAAAGTGAGASAAAAAAAATPAGVKSGDKVLHRCRKCGEENDITGYFRT